MQTATVVKTIDAARSRTLPWLFVLLFIAAVGDSLAAEPGIRIAVLKFGTANWELDTLRHNGFDVEQGFRLEVLPLAGKQATMVALQGKEVDMALTDWLWVSRQRAAGKNFSFLPYSTAAGSLVVPADSDIDSLSKLQGKRLGIAGGPLDKNWLLLRALAMQQGLDDLADTVIPVFGAPPLLNNQLERGRIDAVINFWPYVARLRAQGMRVLLDAGEAAQQLGIDGKPPLIGYVFDAGWAEQNKRLVESFEVAIARARNLLQTSDEAWERLRPLMGAANDAEFVALRDGYREGIPQPMTPAQVQAAARLWQTLSKIGGHELTGQATTLSPGTFWAVADD